MTIQSNNIISYPNEIHLKQLDMLIPKFGSRTPSNYAQCLKMFSGGNDSDMKVD